MYTEELLADDPYPVEEGEDRSESWDRPLFDHERFIDTCYWFVFETKAWFDLEKKKENDLTFSDLCDEDETGEDFEQQWVLQRKKELMRQHGKRLR